MGQNMGQIKNLNNNFFTKFLDPFIGASKGT